MREHARTAGLVASVESDLQAGIKSGVSATPTFFINGTILVGVQPASAFENLIEAELLRATEGQLSP